MKLAVGQVHFEIPGPQVGERLHRLRQEVEMEASEGRKACSKL